MRTATCYVVLSALWLLSSCAPSAQPTPTAAPAKPAPTASPAKPAENPEEQPTAKASPAARAEAKTAERPAAKASPEAKPKAVTISAGTRLSVAAGGAGGVNFFLGGGLATMLHKHLGVQATAEVMPAAVDNMKLVSDRRKDLVAFSLADTAYDALQGRERLKGIGPIQVRSLGVLYTSFLHVVTTEGSGTNTISDLKSKRVSVGDAGSETEIKAERVLEAFNLDPGKDIQRQRLSVAESAGALEDRKLDAFFWDDGLPTGAVTGLANRPSMTITLIAHGDAVSKMNAKYGNFYTQASIPKETYKGMTADVQVAGTSNVLVVHQEFSEEVAYAVLATIFDHLEEWGAVHPEGRNTRLNTAWKDNPVPLHPGAIRFYRDRGVYRGS